MSFWSDLGEELLDLGEDELRSRFNSRYNTDHIQAQNDTVAYMGQVIDAVQRRTFAVEEGVTLITRAVNQFVALANRSGERGRRGAAEVSSLAAQVIRDLRAGSQPAPGGGYDPGTYYRPPGSLNWSSSDWTDYLPYVLAGGAVLLIATRGRR